MSHAKSVTVSTISGESVSMDNVLSHTPVRDGVLRILADVDGSLKEFDVVSSDFYIAFDEAH